MRRSIPIITLIHIFSFYIHNPIPYSVICLKDVIVLRNVLKFLKSVPTFSFALTVLLFPYLARGACDACACQLRTVVFFYNLSHIEN